MRVHVILFFDCASCTTINGRGGHKDHEGHELSLRISFFLNIYSKVLYNFIIGQEKSYIRSKRILNNAL